MSLLFCCIQVSELYCLACENSVCEDCVNGEHAEHPTDSLQNIVDQQLAALQDRVDSAKNRCSHDARHVILSTVKYIGLQIRQPTQSIHRYLLSHFHLPIR